MISKEYMKLGIFGGGQLAQMLTLEAISLGFEVSILCNSQTEPAALIAHHWIKGDANNFEDCKSFVSKINFLTFESEFYNLTALKKSLLETKKKPLIFPSIECMESLQNRSSQKKLLEKNKIPTAEFYTLNDFHKLGDLYDQMGPFVLKKTQGGYDGNGTFIVSSHTKIASLKTLFPNEFIAEKLIQFKQELAIVFVRCQSGKITHYPLVKSHQVDSRCDWVIGPVHHPKLNSVLKSISTMLNKINYVGAIGVELFDTGKDLLVNELAPRVHNTGHYTQDAFENSQFKLHLLSAINKNIHIGTQINKSFCMINLIGKGHKNIKLKKTLLGHLHWYDKNESRKGRKMGHINYTGPSAIKLLNLGLKERKGFQI